MRSLIVDRERRELREEQRPEPEARGSQVKFRIHQAGVCGTDRELASFNLRARPGDATSIVIGHEALGQVVEAGPDAVRFRPGDWVVPTIRRSCPACHSCSRGRSDLCLTNGYSE